MARLPAVNGYNLLFDDRRSAVEAAGLGTVVALPGRKDGTEAS